MISGSFIYTFRNNIYHKRETENLPCVLQKMVQKTVTCINLIKKERTQQKQTNLP